MAIMATMTNTIFNVDGFDFFVDTMLDRLWLEISTTPPTEYVEAANSCEATLPTKVPVSSFEMNLNAEQCSLS